MCHPYCLSFSSNTLSRDQWRDRIVSVWTLARQGWDHLFRIASQLSVGGWWDRGGVVLVAVMMLMVIMILSSPILPCLILPPLFHSTPLHSTLLHSTHPYSTPLNPPYPILPYPILSYSNLTPLNLLFLSYLFVRDILHAFNFCYFQSLHYLNFLRIQIFLSRLGYPMLIKRERERGRVGDWEGEKWDCEKISGIFRMKKTIRRGRIKETIKSKFRRWM